MEKDSQAGTAVDIGGGLATRVEVVRLEMVGCVYCVPVAEERLPSLLVLLLLLFAEGAEME